MKISTRGRYALRMMLDLAENQGSGVVALKDIAARPDGITCSCGSRRYSMEIRRDAVELVCRDCGARLRLSAATDRDLDDLCCHMKLVIPGKQ